MRRLCLASATNARPASCVFGQRLARQLGSANTATITLPILANDALVAAMVDGVGQGFGRGREGAAEQGARVRLAVGATRNHMKRRGGISTIALDGRLASRRVPDLHCDGSSPSFVTTRRYRADRSCRPGAHRHDARPRLPYCWCVAPAVADLSVSKDHSISPFFLSHIQTPIGYPYQLFDSDLPHPCQLAGRYQADRDGHRNPLSIEDKIGVGHRSRNRSANCWSSPVSPSPPSGRSYGRGSARVGWAGFRATCTCSGTA